MAGWSVFTRPSIISGWPVTSATSVTGSPASCRARAVPPVESSVQPRSSSARASSTTPVLSETLSSALGIETRESNGCARTQSVAYERVAVPDGKSDRGWSGG